METQAYTWLVPFQEMLADVTRHGPRLLAALLVLLAAVVLAWVVKGAAGALLKWLKVDEKLTDVWLFRLWSRGLYGYSPSQIAATFFFYAVLFLGILLAVRVLGVAFGQTILTTLLGLVPRVLSFMLILFLGYLMAMFFSFFAQLILASTGVLHASFWGKVVAWGTLAVAVMFSLEQLGLVGQFLTIIVLILLGTLGLGAAIAFGLGCKDLAREFLIEFLREEPKEPGEGG